MPVLATEEEPPSFFSRFFFNTQPVVSEIDSEVAAKNQTELTVHELPVQAAISKTIDLTDQPDDLWIRIRNGFAMMDLNDDLVLYYQQWYLNRPDALRRMVERSRPYMHHIVEEIEARGMPTELALLPMVESSFNPMAYSRAHASGLWQFIPATGKRFKLEQNWWQDQRRDIVASTGAALEYLQTIYDMHGDWHLALASYNWGEGAVKRAIEKNMARGLATDYSSLTMPNETRHYVPKLQALKNIFGNPVLMLQLGLPSITNRPYFVQIEPRRLIDIKTAARLANMPLQEFMALNPSHNRPVIQEDTALVIPTDKIAIFQNNLENTTTPLSAWQAYTLKPGEKLNKLAPRFGITMSDLLRVNGLSAKGKTAPGMTLLVPNGYGMPDPGSLLIAPSQPVAAAQERARSSPSVKQPAPRKVVALNGKPEKADPKSASKTASTAKGSATKSAAKPLASGKSSGSGKPEAKAPVKPAAKPAGKTSEKTPVKTDKKNTK